MFDNELNRFGSAEFADERDIARAGLYEQTDDGLLVAFDGTRPLFEKGMGGLLKIAGARSGKLRDVQAYNICAGVCRQSMVILDMKGELAAISQDQTPDRKHRSEEHTSELQSLMRISYAVFCLKKKKHAIKDNNKQD